MQKIPDPITPTTIDHKVDEIWDNDELREVYNYLEYVFERDGLKCRARVYLDEPNTATILGSTSSQPNATAQSLQAELIANMFSPPAIEADVVIYLSRRFADVKTSSSMLADLTKNQPGKQAD